MKRKNWFTYSLIFECFSSKYPFEYARALFLLLLGVFFLVSSQLEEVKAQVPLIGPVKEIMPSCACNLRSTKGGQLKEKIIFVLNDDGSATINIDGKDTLFDSTRKSEQKGGKDRKKRYVWVFQERVSRKSKPNSELAKVIIYLTLTREYDNGVLYNAVMHVRKGIRRETIKAKGACSG